MVYNMAKIIKNKKPKEKFAHKIDRMIGREGKNYVCHICGKESKDAVDAMAHLIDHGTSALEEVSDMIKDQKSGKVSAEDRKKR